MIWTLLTLLRFDQQPLPYCARCGGYSPAHTH